MIVGSRIGPYEIIARLGTGGMGEVWRAHDTKLKRDVAIKVLPAEFVEDRERLARFEREAQLLAQLNHPNIAQIYGVEASGATHALVMELVEGPTLAERLESGSLSVTESLLLARQIAEALEEAHEKGIIHRDLKPANIKASPEGKVKVLDFGLAKAMDPAGAASGSESPSKLAASPTLTLGATVQGVILGTAAYMSPEQAKGLKVDKRADIWAFGVLLFEMLTGKPLFASDSVADTLARVLQRAVDFEALPSSTPPAVRRLLRHCLERQPRNRLHDIADARLVLDETLSRRDDEASTDRRAGSPLWLTWALVGALAILSAAVGWLSLQRGERSGPFRGQLEIALPPGEHLDAAYRRAIAVSRDGRTIAVIVTSGKTPPADSRQGGRHIEVRAIDSNVFRSVAGTDGALELTFSPDGKWLAFSVATEEPPGGAGDRPYSELRKVPVEGGQPVTLCSNRAGWGLSWGVSGWIVFAGYDGPIFRVRQEGGAVEAVTRIHEADGFERHGSPLLLPDGRTMLYNELRAILQKSSGYDLYALRLDSRERVLLAKGAADPRFAPPDQVFFARDGKIFVLRFDPRTLRFSGEPVPVADGVAHSVATRTDVSETAQAQYDVSDDGLLVLAPGSIYPPAPKEVVRIDPNGRESVLSLPSDQYLLARVSPDGSRLLAASNYPEERPRVLDLGRGTIRSLELDSRTFNEPIWGPGPDQVSFVSQLVDGQFEFLYTTLDQTTTSTVTVARLDTGQIGFPAAWTPNGDGLVAAMLSKGGNRGIWICREGRCLPYIDSLANEEYPALSPDGRWLAFASDESGQEEVWLQPFGEEGSRRLVSVGGGVAPAWSSDGRALFYRRVDPQGSDDPDFPRWTFYRVALTGAGKEIQIGRPAPLFSGEFGGSAPLRSYDVDAQGNFYLTRERKLDDAERLRRAEFLFPTKLRVLVGMLDLAARGESR